MKIKSVLMPLSLFLVLGAALPFAFAQGQTLDAAKAQGLVGEKPDGYLGAVQAPSADTQALIQDVNAKRRQKYQEIAKRNNTPLEAVEKLAAKKAISITPAGQYVQLPNGSWQRK